MCMIREIDVRYVKVGMYVKTQIIQEVSSF